uniref:Preprotein-translocase subunit g n=1 Tax=Caloglossa monosticha TaxID=76906 RepID=A0A1Z1M5M2_9FLOR|nr:preprotein-translocase subunit g [Caloglossa monosticha]ARW61064.1 preprotein-translocase subunit g [Caloglossa monosticha]
MIKLLLYFLSILSILLILFNNPSSSSVNNFSSQNKFLTFSSSQVYIQKIIFFCVILFIIFNVLCAVYT